MCRTKLYGETMDLCNFLWLDEEENWENNRIDAEKGIVFAYVYNKTLPVYSEFGSICVRPEIGGLVRTNQLFNYKSFNKEKGNA